MRSLLAQTTELQPLQEMTFHTFVQVGLGWKGTKKIKKIKPKKEPWDGGLLSWGVLNSSSPKPAEFLAAGKGGKKEIRREENVLFVGFLSFSPAPGPSQPFLDSWIVF